jgi:hypothetical protein
MAALPEGTRKSDRWITPGVIVAAILTTGLVLAVVAAAIAYLTAQGIDPDPMLKLVANVGTGLFALLNLVLTLAGRATAAKVERNTGTLTSVVADVVDAVATTPAAGNLPAEAARAQLSDGKSSGPGTYAPGTEATPLPAGYANGRTSS